MMSVVGQVGRTLSFLECLPSVLRCRRRSEASRASQGSSTGTRRSATQNGEGGKGSRQKSWQRRSKSWQRYGGRGLALGGQGQQKHGIFMFTMAQEAISTRAKCRNGKIPFCWPKRAHHPFQSEDEKKGRKKRIPRANMDAFQSKPVAIGGWSMTRP